MKPSVLIRLWYVPIDKNFKKILFSLFFISLFFFSLFPFLPFQNRHFYDGLQNLHINVKLGILLNLNLSQVIHFKPLFYWKRYYNMHTIEQTVTKLLKLPHVQHISQVSINQIQDTLPQDMTILRNLKTLKLVGCTNFPFHWSTWSNLQKLDLSACKLTSISSHISNMSQLKILILTNNFIRQLPSEINTLGNLETLRLDDNQLTEINNLTLQLATLDVSCNKISIIDASPFDSLNISGNKFCRLVVFKDNSLYNLNMSHLSITTMSVRQFFFCNQLTRLDLSHNELISLPGLECCISLIYLNIAHNKLPDIDVELYNLLHLDISFNQLVTPPRWIGQINQLEFKCLNSNDTCIRCVCVGTNWRQTCDL